MSHICHIAHTEWSWLHENPVRGMRRLKEPKPRDRRISAGEIEKILLVAGYEYDKPVRTLTSCVAAMFLLAIETGMRAGEMVNMTWDHVDLNRRFVHLPETKNGNSRNVPLSPEAIRLLKQVPRNPSSSPDSSVFGLTSGSLDALFRKLKKRAMIKGLHFHDTRHEAITRLAKRLDVLDLARMVGHKNLSMLMVYYNATAEELAERLAQKAA